MNIFFRKTKALKPLTTKRYYEWRKPNGAIYGKPRLCEDACEFWLLEVKAGTITGGNSTNPKDAVYIHVSSTGEKVSVDGIAGVKARLWNEPLTTWRIAK